MSFVENADKTMTDWFANEYVVAAISILLIFYSAFGTTKLPPYILRLFDMPLFKLLLLFLIVYLARKSPTISIIAAIAFMVTLQALTKLKVDELVLDVAKKEAMSNQEIKNQDINYQDIEQDEINIPIESVMGIQDEIKDNVIPASINDDSFFPQYTNMAQDSQINAQNNGQFNAQINGYDPNSNYAAL